MFDPDYDLLSGRPSIRKLYHTGLYAFVEVGVTDIGRAGQPDPPAAIEPEIEPEVMPQDPDRRKISPIRDRIVACLAGESKGLPFFVVAQRTGLTRHQVANCVALNARLFVRSGQRGSLTVRLRA